MAGRHKSDDSASWTEQAISAFDRWTDPPKVTRRGAHVADQPADETVNVYVDELHNDLPAEDVDTGKSMSDSSSQSGAETLTVG
jgi:hypothetical protein